MNTSATGSNNGTTMSGAASTDVDAVKRPSDAASAGRARGRVDLLDSPFIPSLTKFAIPLTFSFLVNMIYSLIDRWFISSLGTDAIAAIGLGEQLGFLVFTLGSGFCMGTGIIVARRIGENDRDGADRIATQAVVFMLGATVLLTVVLELFLPLILERFALSATVTSYAHQYLSAVLLGFVGNLITFQINSIVRSSGNVFYPMVVLLATTLVNAMLAPLFIFVLDLGMYGAGLATAVAQTMGMAFNLYLMIGNKTGIRLKLDAFRFDWPVIRRIVSLGIPSSAQMMAVSLTRISIFKLVAAFGTSVMAAYTLGISVDFIVFMFVFSLGISIEVATGQNLGARKFDRVLGYHTAGLKLIAIIVAVMGCLAYVFGPHFAALYSKDADVIRETQQYLHISVFGYLFFGIGIISARVISGAGAAYLSLAIVAGSIVLLQLPLVYILSHYTGWNQTGIWIGAAAGYALF
ncbi:MAG: MATE family efflux transporter, partial [Candidatus Kapaibacterium sp.]